MSKGKIIILTSLMIILMAGLVIGVTYSYFTLVIVNEGGGFSVKVGTVYLDVTPGEKVELSGNALKPIYTKNVGQDKGEYYTPVTVTRTGSMDVCYNLDIVINDIGDVINGSEYFRYRVVDRSTGEEVNGSFYNVKGEMLEYKQDTIDSEEIFYLNAIRVFQKKYIENTRFTDYYDVYIWLEYDKDVDQTDLLRTKEGKNLNIQFKASGVSGLCN